VRIADIVASVTWHRLFPQRYLNCGGHEENAWDGMRCKMLCRWIGSPYHVVGSGARVAGWTRRSATAPRRPVTLSVGLTGSARRRA